MKKSQIRKKIREQLLKVINEQQSFRASDYDPSKSCIGRGVCCIDSQTKANIEAKFILDHNNKVNCKCPQGTRKVMCEE